MNGKNEDITREDLETIGQNNDIQDCKALIDIVANTVASFEKYAGELDIDRRLIESIQADFIQL